MTDYTKLPEGLPVPKDGGAADGLVGRELPDLVLPATANAPGAVEVPATANAPTAAGEVADNAPSSAELNLRDAAAGLLVAYVYPRTGTPGQPSPEGWDDIPGARGCTPQSCAYRDALAEFRRLGADLVGISAQSPAEQAEFAAREHILYPLLADERFELAAALGLPTFETPEADTFYRRLTFVAEASRIVKVFYPVFPPDRDAAEVLAWLADR